MAAFKNLGVWFWARNNGLGKFYKMTFCKSVMSKPQTCGKQCSFYYFGIQSRNLYSVLPNRKSMEIRPLISRSDVNNVLLSTRVVNFIKINNLVDTTKNQQNEQKADEQQKGDELQKLDELQKGDEHRQADTSKQSETEATTKDATIDSSKSKQQARDFSAKTMKYTFIAFGVLFSGLTGFLVIVWGSPATDADGIPLTDEFSDLPFWKAYPLRFWRELHYYDKMIKEPSREKLLPDPLTEPYYQPPYTVVLEMTGVLVHPDWTYKTGWRFKKRPGVDYFLQQIGPPLYETVIYTSEQGFTAFPIIDTLDPNGYIMYRLFRDATRYMKGHHVKDLSCLNRDLSKVIFIDWNEKSFQLQPENALKLKKWNGNDDDRTLIDLAAFLRTIATNQVDDVRSVLAFYKQFDDPVEGFKFNQKRLQEEKQRTGGGQLESPDRRSSWTSLLFKRWQYLGSTLAEDYINLGKNEGLLHDESLKLLFAAAGDIKDVVKTITDIPEKFSQKIEFVLNDYSPHIMARNVLFLYCSLVQKEFSQLIQIWYSLLLTPSCLKFLCSTLKILIKSSKEQVLKDLKNFEMLDSHWEMCKEIWKGWLRLASNPIACEKVIELREKIFANKGIIEEKLFTYLSTIPQVHKKSLMVFFEKGCFLPLHSSERKNDLHGNPTMTCFNPLVDEYNEKFPDIDPNGVHMRYIREFISLDEEMIYSVRDDAFVFSCWDYFHIKKEIGIKSDIIEMYNLYLEKLLSRFSLCVEKGNIYFHLIIGDFQCLDDYASRKKFDRIATSNLCDYYPTPLLLKKLSPYLNQKNKHSVIINRTENWKRSTQFSMRKMLDFSGTFEAVSLAKADARNRSDVLEGINEPDRRSALLQIEMCSQDYWESNLFVFLKLFSDVLVHQYKENNLPPKKRYFKHPSEIALTHGVKLRDFRLELNHVIPFRREANIRKASILQNISRYIEWYICANQ